MASMRSKFVAEGSLGTVRVNQKALIDKLLARYKDEFAVFRELTQNSDDAGASEVCIVIDEENNVARVSNNGRVFRAEDWERLQSIADGNPDENTTGMFGVGFYSVFALSDFPIVRSGDQALLFEWQGNQLATRTLMLKARGDGQWTDVVLEGLKGKVFDDIKKAGYLKLIRYLAEMLPFARNLRHIEIRTGHTGTSGGLGDITTETNNTDYSLRYQATKIQTPLPYLSVRREARSPAGFFHMEELVASEVQLSIKTYLRTPVPTPTPTPTHTPTSAPIPTPTSASVSVVSPSPSTLPTQTPLAPPTQTTAPVGLQQLLPTPSPAGNEATVQETVPTRKKFDYDMVLTETCYLTLLDTMLSVKVDQATAAAIADILKKNTPSRTRLGLLCQRSSDLARSVASIYTVANDTTVVPPREDRRGLHRFVDRGGRIFVGFPTGQSTGLDVDISAQLYLTMEREHIDFKNEIRTWNEDLIRMCGVALRLYYEKMTSLKQSTLPAHAPAPAPAPAPLVVTEPPVDPSPSIGAAVQEQKEKKRGWGSMLGAVFGRPSSSSSSSNASKSIAPPPTQKQSRPRDDEIYLPADFVVFDEQVSLCRTLRFATSSPAPEVCGLLADVFFSTRLAQGQNVLLVPGNGGVLQQAPSLRVGHMGFERFCKRTMIHPALVEYTSQQQKASQQEAKTYRPPSRPGTQEALFSLAPCFARCLLERNISHFASVGDLVEDLASSAPLTEDALMHLISALVKWFDDGVMTRQDILSVVAVTKWISSPAIPPGGGQVVTASTAAVGVPVASPANPGAPKPPEPYVRFLSHVKFYTPDDLLLPSSATSASSIVAAIAGEQVTSLFSRWFSSSSSSSSSKVDTKAPVTPAVAPSAPPPASTPTEPDKAGQECAAILSRMPAILPAQIGRQFAGPQLEAVLGLVKLAPADLCQVLAHTPDMFQSVDLAVYTMRLIARHVTPAAEVVVLPRLRTVKCIATTSEISPLVLPSEAYLPTVKFVANLNHVSPALMDTVPKKLLVALGVHETVSTKLLLENLEKSEDQAPARLTAVVNHLVDAQAQLQQADWTHLKEAKFLNCKFLLEGTPVQGKEVASHVHFDDPALLELGLPVLCWDTPMTGPQKDILKKIGLKTYPDLDVLLQIASTTPTLSTCVRAVSYLCEHFDARGSNYRNDFYRLIEKERLRLTNNATNKGGPQGRAFVPEFIPVEAPPAPEPVAATPVKEGLELPPPPLRRRSPFAVYCMSGVMSPSLRRHLALDGLVVPELRKIVRERLEVSENPPLQELLSKMLARPMTLPLAAEMFAFLVAHNLGQFRDPDWKRLKDTKFIPIWTPAGKEMHAAPKDLVLYSEAVYRQYGPLLDYVPYESASSRPSAPAAGAPSAPSSTPSYPSSTHLFFQGCGIPDFPDDERIVLGLIRNYQRYFQAVELDAYRAVLVHISAVLERLSPNTRQTLKDTPCFLAVQTKQTGLAKCEACVLVDNQVYFDMFDPLACPRDNDLESLYHKLGSRFLSTLIKSMWEVVGAPRESPLSREMQGLIQERKALLIYDPDTRTKKPALKPDHDLLLKGLRVVEVEKVVKRLTYKNKTQELVQAAGFLGDEKQTFAAHKPVIVISSARATKGAANEIDHNSLVLHGISRLLTELLFTRFKHAEATHIFFVLKNTLTALESEGYPVTAIQRAPTLPVVAPKSARADDMGGDQMVKAPGPAPAPIPALPPPPTATGGQALKPPAPIPPVPAPVPAPVPLSKPAPNEPIAIPTPPIPDPVKAPLPPHPSPAPPPPAGPAPVPAGTLKPPVSHAGPKTNANVMNAVHTRPRESLGGTVQSTGGYTQYNSCDFKPSHDLVNVSGFPQVGLPIYEERDSGVRMYAGLVAPATTLARITKILAASVYKVPEENLVLYLSSDHKRGDTPGTVAFNRGGRLFFNALYFAEQYYPKTLEAGSNSLKEVFFLYYMVFAHELAHNLEHEHNMMHELHLQDIAESFFTPFTAQIVLSTNLARMMTG